MDVLHSPYIENCRGFFFKYLGIYDREGIFNRPVDPVEDVEPPVGAQREEVVAGDGLRLSGLAHHEQLEKSILSVLRIRI